MQHAQHIQRELRAKYGHMMIQWYEMINWSEPLILGIIALHITLFMTVFLTRHRLYLQFALFVLNIVLLVITEELNKWARAHWQLIATQQYFDKRGVFMSIFYAGPLLGLGFFQLVRITDHS